MPRRRITNTPDPVSLVKVSYLSYELGTKKGKGLYLFKKLLHKESYVSLCASKDGNLLPPEVISSTLEVLI